MLRRRMAALELITLSMTASEGDQPLLCAFRFVGDDSSLPSGIQRCLAVLVSIVNDNTHNVV